MKTLIFDGEPYLVEPIRDLPYSQVYLLLDNPTHYVIEASRSWYNYEIMSLANPDDDLVLLPKLEFLDQNERYTWYTTPAFYRIGSDHYEFHFVRDLQNTWNRLKQSNDWNALAPWYELNMRFQEYLNNNILIEFSTEIVYTFSRLIAWMSNYGSDTTFNFATNNFSQLRNGELIMTSVIAQGDRHVSRSY